MDQVLDAKPDADLDEPEPRTVVLKLWPDDAELLDELMQRTGQDASELVGWALGAYWRELEGIVLPPTKPMTLEEMDEVMRQSAEDIRAGRTIPHEQVMAEARAIIEEPKASFTPEQVEQIERGLQAMREGRVKPSSEVFARLDAKYGG